MNMFEFLGGIVLGGIVGIALKDKILGTNNKTENQKKEMDSLYAENEKFSRRNKDMERQVEDLLAELNKVRRQAKANDDDNDDLQDELDQTKKYLKAARTQNDELARMIKEYKTTCESQEAEIAMLKEKLH